MLKKRSKFQGLRSQSGLSLIEVLIALALLGVVTIAAYTVGRTTIVSTSRVSKNIVDALNTDISIRGLNYEIANSEIMRKNFKASGGPMVTCRGSSLLNSTLLQKNQEFKSPGDGFSFVYASRRLVGATSLDTQSAVVVPDTQPFYVGAVVLLTSLDSDRIQSLYAVQNVDAANLTLTLASALPIPPDIMGCALNSGSDNTILNQLAVRKFSIDILAFVRYAVEPDANLKTQNRLVAKVWPLRNYMDNKDASSADIVHSSPVIDNFQSMQMKETFTPTMNGATKGDYLATFKIYYSLTSIASGKSGDKTLDVQAGYRLNGVEVSNSAALPDPVSVEQTYVTCTVISTAIPNTFIRKSHPSEFSTVYRLETLYSEADTLNGGNTPAITATVTPNSPGGDQIQCWSANNVTYVDPILQIGPILNDPGVGTSFSFEKATSTTSVLDLGLNSLVKPIYCYVPVDSQVTANLKYSQVTPDGYLPQNVTCSSADIKGSPTTWTYDDGGPSKCTKDGTIFIGKLLNAGDKSTVGPQLVTSACTWDGAASTSCNAYTVLSANPDALLQRVSFKPAGINIDGADGSEITCE